MQVPLAHSVSFAARRHSVENTCFMEGHRLTVTPPQQHIAIFEDGFTTSPPKKAVGRGQRSVLRVTKDSLLIDSFVCKNDFLNNKLSFKMHQNQKPRRSSGPNIEQQPSSRATPLRATSGQQGAASRQAETCTALQDTEAGLLRHCSLHSGRIEAGWSSYHNRTVPGSCTETTS